MNAEAADEIAYQPRSQLWPARPQTEEGVMHPALTQAAAIERTRGHYAWAAARRHAAQIRRARRPRLVVRARLVRRVLRAA
jgi:hypothetical protein